MKAGHSSFPGLREKSHAGKLFPRGCGARECLHDLFSGSPPKNGGGTSAPRCNHSRGGKGVFAKPQPMVTPGERTRKTILFHREVETSLPVSRLHQIIRAANPRRLCTR